MLIKRLEKQNILHILLCPEIVNTKNTEYFEKIFENAIEFKIRKIVRETYFVATTDVFSSLKTDPNILEIRSRFNFDEMNKDYFIKILRNLVDSNIMRPSKSGNMLRSTRKLAESVYSSKELDIHQRVVQHIGYIIKYMATPLLYRIEVKAISYAQKLKNHYLLEGKESLSIAAVLSFIASREFGIKNSAKYISDETGVSKSYLYTHYREFMSITSNPK